MDLEPTFGAEQAGTRPVIIVQPYDLFGQFPTVVVVPTTTFREDKKAAELPSSVFLRRGDGGLTEDSIALCHQVRVLAKGRLQTPSIGELSPASMGKITTCLTYVLGIAKPPRPPAS